MQCKRVTYVYWSKRTRKASIPRPNTPQAFALSMLCNEPKIQNIFPLMLITHQKIRSQTGADL